jgi:glucose/mannose-6-phosphate isomerase
MTDPSREGQERMARWIDGLPDQLRRSGGLPGLADVAPLATPPAQVLVCGMGGSAMAGSLLADGWPPLTVPVLVHRRPGLPEWVGPQTLVVACSYSGQTAETLDAVEAARARGCRIAAVTSGGRLLALARGEAGGGGFPAVQMPGGQPPRTALGYSLGAQLHLLAALGLLPDPTGEIEAACAQVDAGHLVRFAPDGAPVGDAAARELAVTLEDRLTVIHTAGAEAHGAGRRLLAQLNENAKAPGHHAEYPELNHNEIVGWDLTARQAAGFALIVLHGGDADAATVAGAEVATELLGAQFAVTHRIWAYGESRLARVLGLILFGDRVSAHLAARRGVDPVPIARIDTLKSRLAGR